MSGDSGEGEARERGSEAPLTEAAAEDDAATRGDGDSDEEGAVVRLILLVRCFPFPVVVATAAMYAAFRSSALQNSHLHLNSDCMISKSLYP
jgi:hypothetical protein